MLTIRPTIAQLLRNRRGAVAVIIAVMLPAMLVATALAVETSLIQVRQSQLQAIADAAAGGARQKYDSYTAGPQTAPVTEALRLAGISDLPSSLVAADVVQGWWDITKTTPGDKFGPPVAGQTGLPFSNAVRVTTRDNHPIALGALLGRNSIALASQSTGYKCSNLDYPLTLVPDDPNPPSLPALWLSYATPGHDANTSYYYQQPNGAKNPVIKFYSPIDGEDVSFVVNFSNGYRLQVDTYCRGTYLVAPAAFDFSGLQGPLTATVQRGSTNNSFDIYPDQSKYPFAFYTTTYYPNSAQNVASPLLNLDKVHTTPYPSSLGTQYWASEGNPTPDRRALIVR